MVTIRTKISMVLHFARKSNHSKIVPRLATEMVEGGANQRAMDKTVFVYGQTNENRNMRIASS
jgi:hypothetical protein